MALRQTIRTGRAIAVEAQRAARGDGRVELAQAAGRGVSGVDEQFFSRLGQAAVQAVEAGAGHEDLAAHFQLVGRVVASQAQRDWR